MGMRQPSFHHLNIPVFQYSTIPFSFLFFSVISVFSVAKDLYL